MVVAESVGHAGGPSARACGAPLSPSPGASLWSSIACGLTAPSSAGASRQREPPGGADHEVLQVLLRQEGVLTGTTGEVSSQRPQTLRPSSARTLQRLNHPITNPIMRRPRCRPRREARAPRDAICQSRTAKRKAKRSKIALDECRDGKAVVRGRSGMAGSSWTAPLGPAMPTAAQGDPPSLPGPYRL